jgi:hypothetical protein
VVDVRFRGWPILGWLGRVDGKEIIGEGGPNLVHVTDFESVELSPIHDSAQSLFYFETHKKHRTAGGQPAYTIDAEGQGSNPDDQIDV